MIFNMIVARDCKVCRKRQTMECPNSSMCWSTSDKPYFEVIGNDASNRDR